ncbi:MAG: aspartyl/asparaginyl beta-hydroxylase domain-containing protein [Leptolyngbyaceae bacterium]|nr:aspartyl/asparaginyl beta-hydroxylase domain-containing protein [Leptolyngbyaceae bacterium]
MFYNCEQFDFVSKLESNWQIIRDELTHLREKDFIPWPERYLYGKGWNTFGLYAFGVKVGKNCTLCPETTKLVEQIPDLTSAGFSVLAPGTHIAPHTGYPDGLLRCHLGLVVPEDCALRVADQTKTWTEGKCLVFDDTSEHEAWNRGATTRVVLLIDFKAPIGLLPVPEQSKQPGLPSIFGFLRQFKK